MIRYSHTVHYKFADNPSRSDPRGAALSGLSPSGHVSCVTHTVVSLAQPDHVVRVVPRTAVS